MSGDDAFDDPRPPDTGWTRVHEAAQHDIASLALGEPVEQAVDEHVRACPACSRDLDSYRQVAALARAGTQASDAVGNPPPQVWERITAELGLSAPTAGGLGRPAGAADDVSPVTAHPLPLRWRRALLVAAALLALAGSGIAGWAVGHRNADGSQPASQAVLAAQPGTPATARGTALMHASADGYTLDVTAEGLPARDGYYEVWLYSPSVNQMVSVGTLGARGRGSFTVPVGIDLRAYHVIDVSAQKYDGNNGHERSVLRGPLGP